jgi:hypothetical protein
MAEDDFLESKKKTKGEIFKEYLEQKKELEVGG